MIRALLLALLTLAVFAPEAAAVYDPATGRWLTRDPAGTAPHVRIGQGAPSVRLPDGRIHRPSGFQPLAQYADGTNLYQYARSNSIRFGDPYGLESCEYCGPDISGWLSNELVTWYNWVAALMPQIKTWAAQDAPWYEPDFVRRKSYHYAFLALAGRQMTYFPNTTFSSANCPTEKCANTVTLNSTCIHTSEVGNLVYGAVARYFRMTWLQTWGGSIAGNRGKRTDADAAGVGIGFDFGGDGGVFHEWLGTIDADRLATLGSDAPPECKPCTESVAPGQNHVGLPAVTPTMNQNPLKIDIPSDVR